MDPVKVALRLSLPVLAVYFPIGLVFGFLFEQEGYTWWLAPLASAVIYGGSMQFPMLAIMAVGGSLGTVALMTFAIAARFLFYGISISHRYTNIPWLQRIYLAFGLVDATFMLVSTHTEFEGEDDRKFIWTITGVTHIYWIVGSLVGALIGAAVPMDIPGLEFTLTALFVVLALEQYKKIRDVRPFLVGGVAVALAEVFMPHHLVLGGIGAALAMLPMWEVKQ